MAELIIGGAAVAAFVFLTRFAEENRLKPAWWEWVLTYLWLLYMVFVLEVIVSFLREGTPKGAVVLGTIMGFIAVVWGVGLGRTVFRRRPSTPVSWAAGGEGDHHV
jgi:hypothetical protein